MDVAEQREGRIKAALTRCATDLGGERLHKAAYEQWRAALRHPNSVPTALAIGGSNAEFATVCAGFGIRAIGRPPRRTVAPLVEVVPPEPSATVWDQEVVSTALRRCAADLGNTPAAREYEAWRLRQNTPNTWPPVRAINDPGWAWQLNLAGQRVESRRRSDAEIWAHVQVIRDRLGPSVTRAEYDRFRTSHPQLRLVSSSTLRVRTGHKWSQLFGADPTR